MKIKIPFVIIILVFSLSLSAQNRSSDQKVAGPANLSESNTRTDLIQFAKKLLGVPYLFASSNPLKGFDCSGFVNYVYKNFKINLPRGSGSYKNLGTTLQPEQFKVGDVLIFYGFKDKTRIGHVGIICEAAGMNSRFIHSSSGKAQGVTISELGSAMYKSRFYKCIDVMRPI